jgi:hypothetical protein
MRPGFLGYERRGRQAIDQGFWRSSHDAGWGRPAARIPVGGGGALASTPPRAPIRYPRGCGVASSAQLTTIPVCAAHAPMSRFSIAAAIDSGKRSGVQANVGMPSAANPCACSWSYAGAPSSDSARAARSLRRPRQSARSSPPSIRSLTRTRIVSFGRCTSCSQ